MKNLQKGLLTGLFVGGLGTIPLLFWLLDIRAKFRCPHCDEPILIQKLKGNLKPKIATAGPGSKDELEPDTSPEIA